MDYQALVKTIAVSLVTKPESVEVSAEKDAEGVLRVLIHVAEEDTGRVIGRRGATINAIRQIVRVSSVKGGDSVEVDVAETGDRNADAE
ncbi:MULTISPECIES: KH domain-containing protein [unclassified Pyramidobacter]|uniref:KH domain-containing protein n=1 Tax=unclassified Pyramidobacter TaxID=2632171 RepID=UPI0025F29A74|nr:MULTISPECIES: KH domain-containing protein [unclassified Pyramidobacter]MCI7402482.1 KH domain-containing protein [Pyramidobacter sp.]MDY3211419.1 KH domain-containing protein [Pyramidobacter sp.]WOL41324.1 KH domain-containing protein [Pyramidobacter sp. YE332]